MTQLHKFVERIRTEQNLSVEVPGFDPHNGNEAARFLLVLEAPGARAVGSGIISFDNPDQTAANLKQQLQKAGVRRSDIALWNVVPWYLGNGEKTKIRPARFRDISQCLRYLTDLVALLKQLECIVLVGAAARKAHVHLSHTTNVRILSCHHPSPRVKNYSPASAAENVAVFRAMKRLSKKAIRHASAER
jgi:uracil-DNA glycosylase family 4